MIPWFEYHIFWLGPVPIRAWGLLVATGIGVSLVILWRQAIERGFAPEMLVDQALWAVVGGFVGARLAHTLLYQPAFYLARPLEVFRVWDGGWSSFGGFAGAGAGFLLFAYRRGIRDRLTVLRIADLFSYAAVFGWMIGRVGCVLIHDHPGGPCNCVLDFASPNGPKLDMALLEIIGLLPLAVWVLAMRPRRMRDGAMTAIVFAYYGILRFALDFWRTGDNRYFGLTPAQYFAILLLLLCGWFWVKEKATPPNGGKS